MTYAGKGSGSGTGRLAHSTAAGTQAGEEGRGARRGGKGDPRDEFKVKREEVFEFAEKPKVTREGDKVTIAFETKGFCDVTVAIEDANGKIIRHLASGVLGAKAPEPFQKDSKKQTVVWDGKNDQGEYVDDKDTLHGARVAGAEAAVRADAVLVAEEADRASPIRFMRAAPEGVYVAESDGVDQVRLFDHQGNYLRTVYPFPADKLDKVAGLKMHTFPQDGKTLPLKRGSCTGHAADLRSDRDTNTGMAGPSPWPPPAVTCRPGWQCTLNRLAADGSSGGLPLEGPSDRPAVAREMLAAGGHDRCACPR